MGYVKLEPTTLMQQNDDRTCQEAVQGEVMTHSKGILRGVQIIRAFPFSPNSGTKLLSEIKWNGLFRFGATGIFTCRTSFEGGPL